MAALNNFTQAYYDPETNTYKYVDNYYESYNEGLHYNYFWNQGYGANMPIYQDSLNPFYNNSMNLFKYYFRTGKVSDVNIQLSKGYSTFSYNIGLGYYTEKYYTKTAQANLLRCTCAISSDIHIPKLLFTFATAFDCFIHSQSLS